jgi:exosortase/archaeosortase family protein
MMFLKSQNAYMVAKIWAFFCLLMLSGFILTQKNSYMEFDVLGMWVLCSLAILYLAGKKTGQFSDNEKQMIFFIGIVMCVFSFISIPLGITNPPYSIGELTLFLSGIGVVIFSSLNFRSLILPVSIPFIAVIGWGIYEIFIRNQNWITAPIIPFIVVLTIGILNLFGIKSVSDGNIISFISQTGSPIYLSIVSDCTGIWSLGTFTITVIIVLSSFPKSISKKSILLIGFGYIGTFCANIIRIVVISLSGYYFGPTGAIEQVHVHIGWIVFSIWLIIFWYYYFTRYVGISFFKKKKIEIKKILENK